MGCDLVVLVLAILSAECLSPPANRPPRFVSSPYSFNVDENQRGQVLTTLQAIDPDGDPIKFSIDIDDYFDIQQVNSTTVNVVSTRGIDYERNANVHFTVTATDETSNSKTTLELSVNVRDLNDNGPIIAQGGSSSFTIAEAERVGYRIRNAFRVTDADTGANAQTKISCFVDKDTPESSRACEAFYLEASRVSNGNYAVDIVLNISLDFETFRSYIMAVKAVNTAPPANFTTRNYVINVLDSQDQLPVFLKAPYSPIPLEERALGSVMDVISVRDGDREAQPARNLQLRLLNDTRGWLNLSPLHNNSGIFTSNLTVKSRMDREEYHTQPVYTVAITVSELYPNGSVDASAVSTSHITVQIFDINDNAPEFFTGTQYKQKLIAPLQLEVEEGLGVNTNLPGFLMSVVDRDVPPNNQFEIHMEGFGKDTFQLSPKFGTGSVVISLSVKKEANLDYEKEKYRRMELAIIATDRSGLSNLTRQASVIIQLIDKNDNFPHFVQGVYSTRVSRDVLAGSPIIAVNATDQDSGDFGRTTFSLGQASDLVRIDSTTGVVYLIKQPREGSDPRYEVELVVTDGGGKSTTAKLIVNFNNEFSERPKFDSHIYNATVYENRSTFNNAPVRVRAVDADSVLITYSIIAGNTRDNAFMLHPTSGLLTLRRALVKQDGQQFDLTVLASDGELNDTAHIIIDLLDYNDYTPRFVTDAYAKSIPESTLVGTSVLNITARDRDGADEDGGRVKYYILSGDNSQRFYIDSNTGQLSVNAELDYDTQTEFVLRVKAEDQGTPSRSAIAIVTITITDINNRLPRFYNDLYVQYMSEDAPVRSTVVKVSAFDLDRNSLLRYNIVSESFTARDPFSRDVISSSSFDFRNAFAIDAMTGDITTTLTFNRNVVSYISFKIRVVDINGEQPRVQQNYAQVQVTIRQEGVGVPEFLNEPWTVTDQRIIVNVTEGRTGLILNLIAVDSISHERVTRFREVAGDPEGLFTVHINGEVDLNRPLDYEVMLSRTRKIIVDAVTSAGVASSATLEVHVININDNSPQFILSEYKFTLIEARYIHGLLLGPVSATDRDGDVNLVYKLTGRYSNLFYIDHQGYLYVRNNTNVDAESVSKFNIYVEVTDRVVGGRTTTMPVTITVKDSNEYSPICVQPLFTFFAPKSAVVGRGLGQVLATDDDVGDTVRYFVDDLYYMFSVHQTTGVISTVAPLSGIKQDRYDFSVRARDSTRPYREVECNVSVVFMTAQRTNPLIFITPSAEGATYDIKEESAFNTTVVIMLTRNADNSVLDDVRYSLANTIDSQYFGVDPLTGRVYILKRVDREVQQRYELIVVARTRRSEVSRKFYVNLSDIDDNDPKFSECGNLSYPLKLEVEEGRSGGERSIGIIKACDKDGGQYSSIYYYIVSCNDGSSTTQQDRFSIDLLTGKISVDPKTLDREISSSHTLCVNSSTSKTIASIRSDQWKVVIIVKDRDDHELEFVKSNASVVMSGDVGTGQEIVRITASDRDLSTSNAIEYRIVSIEYTRSSEVVKSSAKTKIQKAFTISKYTGKVTTNLPSYIDLIGGYFLMKIRANTSTDITEMHLKVFVSHPSEQLVLVFDQPPDKVKKFISNFFRELEDIHGYKFIMQKIAYHEDPNTQQTELNMTDVYLYVLDKDGSLVNSSTVASILRSAYNDRQAALFKNYGVVDGDPRTSRLVTAVKAINWYYYEWIWWLIIASAIVLIIDALILLFCLLYLYKMYITKPSQRTAPNVIYVR